MNRRTFIKSLSLFLVCPWIPFPKIEAAPVEEIGLSHLEGKDVEVIHNGVDFGSRPDETVVWVEGYNLDGKFVTEIIRIPRGSAGVETKFAYKDLKIGYEYEQKS